MPQIILPQVFLHAPNTFKPVSHIGSMNNTSSTVLNFKTWFTACVHVPKPKLYLYKFFNIIFPYIVPKPKLYLYKFFNIIFPYIVRKPKRYQYNFFTIIFPYIVLKPKLYLYKFFNIICHYIVRKPEQSRASQLVWNKSKQFPFCDCIIKVRLKQLSPLAQGRPFN